MQVPIKSKDGIETNMFNCQMSDYNPDTNQFTVIGQLSQKDGKEFVNPETITVKVELDAQTSQTIIDAIVTAFNSDEKK